MKKAILITKDLDRITNKRVVQIPDNWYPSLGYEVLDFSVLFNQEIRLVSSDDEADQVVQDFYESRR